MTDGTTAIRPLRSRRLLSALLALPLMATAFVACGSEDDDPTDSTPESSATSDSSDSSDAGTPDVPDLSSPPSTWRSTEVDGHELVADTQIRMTFSKGNLSVNAGCNTLFGSYEQSAGRVSWTAAPARTMMGCTDELMAQDDWLEETFTGGVDLVGGPPDLTLSAGDVTMSFMSVPERDLGELFGKSWRATGTISGPTTTRLPRSVRPRVVMGANGVGRLNTGCNAGRITVVADETSLDFGHPAITDRRCREPERSIERTLLDVLDGRSDEVVFSGAMLVVYRGEAGVVFHVY